MIQPALPWPPPGIRSANPTSSTLLRSGASIGFIVAIIGVAFFGGAGLPKLKIGMMLAGCSLAAGLWAVFGGKGDPRWRRRAIVGLLLALSGIIGLWGIGFFTIDLMRSVFTKAFIAEGMKNFARAS